jgi:hypothetical protein
MQFNAMCDRHFKGENYFQISRRRNLENSENNYKTRRLIISQFHKYYYADKNKVHGIGWSCRMKKKIRKCIERVGMETENYKPGHM